VLVIEHNLDVIKTADWIVDMGPEGGNRGGLVVAEGTPEDVAANPDSHTGSFLRPILEAGDPVAQPKAKRAPRKTAVAARTTKATTSTTRKAPAKKAAATKATAKKTAAKKAPAKRATKRSR
jgi:excinuclease ABC subunit A